MIRRRRLLQASASLLALPAIVETANAQSAFNWKQFKGQKIEVNLQKSPRSDVLQKFQPEFEEMTGIKVGAEQIPEQQQRPKVAMEMSTGHPSFDVVNVAMHVQKRLIERANWMADLRPFVGDPKLTAPDYDIKDFGAAGMRVSTGPDGKLNVMALNEDLFILMYNRALL
jgi:multiple sugar transport system substrate-binding protein